ncbi:hypothetical protein MSG28_004079 [Choristoneura fumiferana]|uniref:Uncharacterized protein n=1 Tax=Choristoneura fumiferana TaxID=7141 RepID=A0ACC0KI10_CHOFU|nr:hypothetical protein MSG28_004079 [Choristoneura fumiferana]
MERALMSQVNAVRGVRARVDTRPLALLYLHNRLKLRISHNFLPCLLQRLAGSGMISGDAIGINGFVLIKKDPTCESYFGILFIFLRVRCGAAEREVTAAPSHFAAHISLEPVTAALTARLSPPHFTGRPPPDIMWNQMRVRDKRGTDWAAGRDLARSNSRRGASQPVSTNSGIAWRTPRGFISAEISGVFTLHARGTVTPDIRRSGIRMKCTLKDFKGNTHRKRARVGSCPPREPRGSLYLHRERVGPATGPQRL